MKKSTIWTLVISIILIVASFALTAAGIFQSAHQVTYDFGYGYYRTVSFNGYTPVGHMLRTFGVMCFVLGIGGMVLFTYLAITTPGPEKKGPDPHQQPKGPAAEKKEFAEKARMEAEDAQVAPETPTDPTPSTDTNATD